MFVVIVVYLWKLCQHHSLCLYLFSLEVDNFQKDDWVDKLFFLALTPNNHTDRFFFSIFHCLFCLRIKFHGKFLFFYWFTNNTCYYFLFSLLNFIEHHSDMLTNRKGRNFSRNIKICDFHSQSVIWQRVSITRVANCKWRFYFIFIYRKRKEKFQFYYIMSMNFYGYSMKSLFVEKFSFVIHFSIILTTLIKKKK